MILHGIDTPSDIVHGNTLEKPYREYGERDRVPVIATNPPFGGMEQDGIENNFPNSLRTRETADLFMALIIKLLKTGGRAAVVLHDGFLFGEGVKSTLKQSLIEECNLHTIVRLPNGVFAPYTGIKTNILFFTKGVPTKDVWFYEHPYPGGVTSYNKSKPMRFEEFEAEQAWWGAVQQAERQALEHRFLSGADCKWTPLAGSKATFMHVNGRAFRLSPTKEKRWLLHRIEQPTDTGDHLGVYATRGAATKVVGKIAYIPDLR